MIVTSVLLVEQKQSASSVGHNTVVETLYFFLLVMSEALVISQVPKSRFSKPAKFVTKFKDLKQSAL